MYCVAECFKYLDILIPHLQDILKKCLEMLNSDISDTETQPQPDVDRDSMSSASSNFSIDIKAELGDQEKFDKLSVKTTSPLCEGLLKIASPVPPLPPAQPSVTKAHVTPPSPSPSPTPSSGPPSPGPPVLEPMTSLPRTAPQFLDTAEEAVAGMCFQAFTIIS